MTDIRENSGDAIRNRLSEYYTPEESDMWITSPHPQLEGQRPIDVMARGDYDAVHAILDRLDGDGYL